MSDLQIAVIIVTYRTAQLTIENLRALEAERSTVGLRICAIVIDNDSGDSPAIAQAIESNGWSAWVTLIAAPKNGGFGYGNNLGMSYAFEHFPPTYIYLLNPDAQVRPGAIGYLARFLETHPEAGIAGGSFEDQNGNDKSVAFRFPTLRSEFDAGLEFGLITRILQRWVVPQRMGGSVQSVDWICGASMMIRPAVIKTIGGFDENYFLYYEETDFCYRAKKAGFSTWYVPESRVMHIAGQSTKVTDLTSGPKRLPDYWFESRRRYFAVTYGIRHAIAVDVAALVARLLGWVKRNVLRRRHSTIPFYIRDLIRHSIIWPRNRDLPEFKGFIPRA